MLQRSAAAPIDWTQEHTEAAVRTIVLDHSPDLVAFQELPGVVPYIETHAMVKANPRSHSGNLATLVDHHLMEPPPTVQVIAGCAVLTTFVDLDLTVANVHLSPGKVGRSRRLEQLAKIVETSPTTDLAVIGDTNTRRDEEADIRTLGLVGERPPEPTWDSKRNHFHPRGPQAASGPQSLDGFVAYFTRHFTTPSLRVTELRVHSTPDFTDSELSFHLSDHYAYSGRIDCGFTTETAPDMTN